MCIEKRMKSEVLRAAGGQKENEKSRQRQDSNLRAQRAMD